MSVSLVGVSLSKGMFPFLKEKCFPQLSYNYDDFNQSTIVEQVNKEYLRWPTTQLYWNSNADENHLILGAEVVSVYQSMYGDKTPEDVINEIIDLRTEIYSVCIELEILLKEVRFITCIQ